MKKASHNSSRLIDLLAVMLSLLLLVLVLLVVVGAQMHDVDDYYDIPNPFKARIKDGKYLTVRSKHLTKTVKNGNHVREFADVKEYVHLQTGLSYSLHVSQSGSSSHFRLPALKRAPQANASAYLNDEVSSSRAYAILTDSRLDKIYYIANPLSQRGDDIDCALDQHHHHRHVFPYKYSYPLPKAQSGGRTQASIYGVIAIWQNAIKRNVSSNHPFQPKFNSWTMSEAHLKVEFVFRKRSGEQETASRSQVDSLELLEIGIERSAFIVPSDDSKDDTSKRRQHQVSPFEQRLLIEGIDVTDSLDANSMTVVTKQLAICRDSSIGQFVFPSLLHYLNESPQHMFRLTFYESVSSSEQLKSSRFATVEQFYHQQRVFAKQIPDDDDSSQTKKRYLRRFTENLIDESKVDTNGSSTVDYRIDLNRDRTQRGCFKNARAPPSSFKRDPLMSHRVSFNLRAGGLVVGKLYGLSALLLNAAQIDHKTFRELRNTELEDDAAHKLRRVNEWKLTDEKYGRTIVFSFNVNREAPDSCGSNSVRDLWRADVYLKNGTLERRYEMLKVENAIPAAIARKVLEKPTNCKELEPSADDDDDDDDGEPQDDGYEPEHESDTQNKTDDDADDADREFQDEEDAQDFDAGDDHVDAGRRLPSLEEYLEGTSMYRMLSSVRVAGGSTETQFSLLETIDDSSRTASYRLHSKANGEQTFFVDYAANFLLSVSDKQPSKCEQVECVDKWLRLFSAPFKFSQPLAGDEYIERRADKYGVGAFWQRAASAGLATYAGARRKQAGDPLRLVWRYDLNERLKARFEFEHEAGKRPHPWLANITLAPQNTSERNERSAFARVVVRVDHYTRAAVQERLEVPGACVELAAKLRLEAAKRAALESEGAMPSFWGFARGQQAHQFSLYYCVKSGLSARADLSDLSGDCITVSETFDLNTKRGLIEVGAELADARKVFIDGSKRQMHAYTPGVNGGRCKQVHELAGLLSVVDSVLHREKNTNFDQRRLYGLSALWIELGKYEESAVRFTTTRQIQFCQVHVHRWLFPVTESGGRQYRVEVEFWQETSRELPNLNQRALKRIELIPEFGFGEPLEPAPAAQILVRATEAGAGAPATDWQLPEVCLHAELDSLPAIRALLDSRSVHLRAELSIAVPGSGSRESFLLDEWYSNQQVRVTSVGLSKLNKVDASDSSADIDALVYCESDQVFDVSQRHNCKHKPPILNVKHLSFERTPREPPATFKLSSFWSDNSTRFEHPLDVFLGPLALWLNADKQREQLELVNKLALLPETSASSKDRHDEMVRVMSESRWRLKSGAATGARGEWCYELTFEEQLAVGGQTKRVSVLRRVDFYERSPANEERHVAISVYIATWFDARQSELRAKLRLPQGFGCQPKFSASMSGVDELAVQLNESLQLDYEASLETLESQDTNPSSKDRFRDDSNAQSGERRTQLALRPLISGALFSGGAATGRQLQVTAKVQTERLFDGSRRTRKTVVDKATYTQYSIDERTGGCRAEKIAYNTPRLALEFPPLGADNNDSVVVWLDDAKLNLLLYNTLGNNFKLLNEFAPPNWDRVRVYELAVNKFELTRRLRGPASIVRTYKEVDQILGNASDYYCASGDGIIVRKHWTLTTKLYLFADDERRELSAILTLNVPSVSRLDIVRQLQVLSVSECYNCDGQRQSERRKRAFAIDYPLEAGGGGGGRHQVTPWQRNAVAAAASSALISDFDVFPLQFVGSQQVAFAGSENGDDTLSFQFELFEPRTSSEFMVLFEHSQMPDELLSASELRLLPTLADCSQWCDSLNCMAMSYCIEGNVCAILRQIAELRAVRSTARLATDLNSVETLQPQVGEPQHKSCQYFLAYYPIMPWFDKRLDELVAQLKQKSFIENLFKVVLTNDFDDKVTTLKATTFREVLIDFELDDTLDDQDIDALASANEVFRVLTAGKTLTKRAIATINKEGAQIDQKTGVMLAAECLRLCQQAAAECQMFAYCSETNTCTSIWRHPNLSRLISDISIELASDISNSSNHSDTQYQANDKWLQNQSGCLVSVSNQLALFKNKLAFRGWQATPDKWPTTFKSELDDLDAAECAARCVSTSEFNCLSFDICFSGDKQVAQKFKCFLQTAHLLHSNFESSTKEQAKDQSVPNFVCIHYSKDVLLEFQKFPKRHYKPTSLMLAESESLEHCALDCYSMPFCFSFEYCYNNKQAPTHSCVFLNQSTTIKVTTGRVGDSIGFDLVRSTDCSIHALTGRNRSSEDLDEPELGFGFYHFSRVFIRYVAESNTVFIFALTQIAIIVALVLQIVLFKLRGKYLQVTSTRK